MSRHFDSSTTTQTASIVVQYGRSSRSSWATFTRSSFGRTVKGKAIWENPIETWLGEGFQLGVSFRTPSKRVILICGWHKNWLERKHWSDVESTQQRNRFGRNNIFPGSCVFGLHSKTMWKKQKYCGQLQNRGRIANFSGVNRKTSILRSGGSCQELCRTILWVGKQEDSTTLQSIYCMLWRPSFQRRRIEIRGRSVTSLLSNCSDMLVLVTYWKTWYSMVSA